MAVTKKDILCLFGIALSILILMALPLKNYHQDQTNTNTAYGGRNEPSVVVIGSSLNTSASSAQLANNYMIQGSKPPGASLGDQNAPGLATSETGPHTTQAVYYKGVKCVLRRSDIPTGSSCSVINCLAPDSARPCDSCYKIPGGSPACLGPDKLLQRFD